MASLMHARDGMPRTHVFDAHVDSATRWLHELGGHLALDPSKDEQVLRALRAGLRAIRDRLPAHEVLDLGAQLPALVRGLYFEGWRLDHAPKRVRDREGMLAAVKKELGPEHRLEPIDVLRGVIRLLGEHVSDGELADVVATLPKPLAALWRELGGTALVATPAAHFTRRTGYSR
jgi:uncharacterized protein (DUF2267 family)